MLEQDKHLLTPLSRRRKMLFSFAYYYKKLIALRKQHAVMTYGHYELILPEHEQIFAYTRELDCELWLVILNFFGEQTAFELLAHLKLSSRELIISNYNDVDGEQDIRSLAASPLRSKGVQAYEITAHNDDGV